MNAEQLKQNLEQRGFACQVFANRAEAVDYLDKQIDGTTVGIGGSMTVKEIGLYDALVKHNTVAWHMLPDGKISEANAAEVYISSLNGLAETGELINIDGSGNRLAATSYGAKTKKVYFVVGQNKIAPDFEQALWRARNIAAPKNAARFKLKTPCVLKEPRCYDCKSPDRLCRELLVHWTKPMSIRHMEIVVILEDLGY